MTLELKDMVDKIADKSAAPADQAPAQDLYRPFMADLLKACDGKMDQAEKLAEMIAKSGIFVGAYKDVTSTSVGPVRIDSLFPAIALIENRDHPFLNGLRSKPRFRCTDYNVRIPEEDAGTEILNWFNLDGSMPAVVQATLDARYNTVGALGQSLKVSWMAQELAMQGPYNRNEDADQLARALNRIDRSLNQYMWANTRVNNEVVPNVPQPGGFYTRSTANVSAITGNLTDAIITGMVDQIANYFGYQNLNDLVMMVPRAQLPVIRNLLINRFPGTTALTQMEFTNMINRDSSDYGFKGYPVNFFYQDNNGINLPIFVDDQAPSQVAELFRASYPQLGGFEFRGQYGPHLVQLPIALFTSYVVVFDLVTLIDPLVVSRSVRTGVGSS
jgi:hypothetical protein